MLYRLTERPDKRTVLRVYLLGELAETLLYLSQSILLIVGGRDAPKDTPTRLSIYALQRRQRYSAYSSVSSPVSGSIAIWPIVTQPSLQAWGASSWSSWCGAAWKGSPAGDILMVSTVTSKSVWAAPPGD